MHKTFKTNPGIQYNFDCHYHNVRHELSNVWKWVRDSQILSKTKSKNYYDKNSNKKLFITLDNAKKNKLSQTWSGLYEVVRNQGPVNTVISIKNALKVIHNNRLKHYYLRI